jgi:tetratricopeptide (TPR) repeat protein
MAVEQPEKILIFTANPLSYTRLRIDEEVRTIQNALRGSRKVFDVQLVLAARSEELRHEILYKKPAYVHFCGHGAPGGIVLDDNVVSAEALAGLFKLFSAHVRCVVLNACFSSRQAHAIVAHVEHVVGMSAEIEDEAAIAFAAAFYDTLGAGQTVDFAFEAGVNGIQLAGKKGHLTPQLLSRTVLAGRTEDSTGLCVTEAIADLPSGRVSEAIADLRSGRVPPSGLDWHEFQKVVYHLISQRLQLQQDTKVSFSDHDRGDVDIVIEYPTLHPTLQSTTPIKKVEKCFIECKRHTGYIELDSAAKVFCAAIQQRPSRLCWVTLDGLSPQAWDYARHFFRTDGAGDRSLTEVGFEHVQFDTLLSLRAPTERISHAVAEFPAPSLEMLDWQLVEHGTFYQRVVASRAAPPAVVDLQADQAFSLRIWLARDAKAGADIRIRGSGGDPDPRFTDVRLVGRSDTQVEMEAAVSLVVVARGEGSGSLTVELRTRNGPVSTQVAFPELRIHPSPSLFPDLREDESLALAARLAAPNGERITFVSGEGGIGKSYLCERAASILVRRNGFVANSFSVLAASEHLVLRIALSLLRPARAAAAGDDDVLRVLLNAWMTRGEGSTGPDASSRTGVDGVPPGLDAAAISACAGLLADNPLPRILYVQNCQDLSPRDVKALGLLVSELDSREWGGVRLLLESRVGSGREYALWEAFVRNTRENLRSCRELRVRPLEPARVEAGVRTAFLTESAALVAASLVEKAGGNPLYLTQVVHHLVDVGACRCIVDEEGRARLLVEDRVRFDRKLRELPAELEPLLRSRLERYFAAEAADGGAPLPEYMALLSTVGPEFGRARLARALELEEARMPALEWRLVRDGFLVHAPGGAGMAFVHDLMRLAAAAVGRETAAFADAAGRLERLLDAGVDREALVGGTLNLWLMRHERALHWFETAYERAHGRGDYALQREALLGSGAAADHLPARTLPDKLKRIEVLMALGWTEMQTGSQAEAVEVYRRAHRRAADVLADGGAEERRRWRHEDTRIRHHILTCLLHMQRFPEALELLDGLVDDIVEVDRLFHVMNRYLRLCGVTGLAGAGWRVAGTACGLAELLDPEYVSVIMSDAGHLYALEAPQRTLELWRRGVETTRELRQRTHSQANVLIGTVLAGQTPTPSGEFEELLRTVTGSGITGQLTRLSLYAGVRDALAGEWDAAVHWFEKALTDARLRNQLAFEWQACCNLGVAAVIAGESAVAARYFSLAAGLAAPLLGGWSREAGERLAERFDDRARTLCRPDQHSALTDNALRGWEPPAVGGVYWRLLHNVARLREDGMPLVLPRGFRDEVDAGALVRATRLVDSSRNALAIQTRHDRLSLVIE